MGAKPGISTFGFAAGSYSTPEAPPSRLMLVPVT